MTALPDNTDRAVRTIGKGAVRFKADDPVPPALVRRIAKASAARVVR